VQGIRAQQDVKWGEFEWASVHLQSEFNKVEMNGDGYLAKDLHDEFGVSRQEGVLVDSV